MYIYIVIVQCVEINNQKLCGWRWPFDFRTGYVDFKSTPRSLCTSGKVKGAPQPFHILRAVNLTIDFGCASLYTWSVNMFIWSGDNLKKVVV